MKNPDLSVKILLRKWKTALQMILVLEIIIKLWCLYMVQQNLHQIKAPQFYTDLSFKSQC